MRGFMRRGEGMRINLRVIPKSGIKKEEGNTGGTK
jgi:hypothetical protein